MAITRTAMVDDDGSGTTGTIINNAWKTELPTRLMRPTRRREHVRDVAAGSAHDDGGPGGANLRAA